MTDINLMRIYPKEITWFSHDKSSNFYISKIGCCDPCEALKTLGLKNHAWFDPKPNVV